MWQHISSIDILFILSFIALVSLLWSSWSIGADLRRIRELLERQTDDKSQKK
jgi:hypothetical protein